MGMDDDKLAEVLGAATPGPWAAFGQLWYATIATANDSGEHRLCFMAHSNGLNDARDEANATLIALTPTLAADWLRLNQLARDLTARCAALDAQVAEAREVIKAMLSRDTINTCQHDNTHRGGFIWEICEDCGGKWADDMGGKPEWRDPTEWTAARAWLGKASTDAS